MTNKYSHFHCIAVILLLAGWMISCTTSIEPPDHVHGNKGAKYWEQRKFDLAEKETRKAIEINPNSSLWYQNLGFILRSTGKNVEAIEALRKSLEIDEDWGNAYKTESLMEIAYYYYSDRNYKKTISILNKALDTAIKEDVPSETLKLIYLYLSYNYTDGNPATNPYYNLNKAQELKAKAYEIDPNDLFVKASITKLLILQNKLHLAENNIKEIEDALVFTYVPNSSAVYSYLGHIYSLLNNARASSDAMMKAIDLNPAESSRYLISELNNDFMNVSNAEEMKNVIDRAETIMKR